MKMLLIKELKWANIFAAVLYFGAVAFGGPEIMSLAAFTAGILALFTAFMLTKINKQ